MDGNLSFSDNTTGTSVVLGSPFTMSSEVIIGAQASGAAQDTSFTSTVTATVPLPAGGLLLLTALGGMAALRRRRKAA